MLDGVPAGPVSALGEKTQFSTCTNYFYRYEVMTEKRQTLNFSRQILYMYYIGKKFVTNLYNVHNLLKQVTAAISEGKHRYMCDLYKNLYIYIYIIQFLHADSISLTPPRARHPTLQKLL